MATYNMGTYKTGSFRKFRDYISNPLIIQIHILHWYHAYIIHPVMDKHEL